jgi:hypothetical protein
VQGILAQPFFMGTEPTGIIASALPLLYERGALKNSCGKPAAEYAFFGQDAVLLSPYEDTYLLME